ncbi:MAG: YqeG family HAD IIIA-type phosphatase [Eubacteriales bacterium]|nr:YqeG family HAD IIIA-type phosphatase [Eubacteriales bacterium]
MPFSLLPTIMVPALTDVSPELLHARNIRLLMLDFDNTIVPYTTNVPTAEMDAWLRRMKDTDITVCIVSNSHSGRVPAFCEKYGLPCITHAVKPFHRGIRRCLARFGVAPAQAALVGDQIFTDTLGANGCGVTSILVEAIDNHNIWLKARHVLELPPIYFARKRRIINHEKS